MDALMGTLFDLALFLLTLGTLGLVVTWTLLRGLKPRVVVLSGTLTMGFMTLATLFLPQWADHMNWVSQITGYFSDQVQMEKSWASYLDAMSKLGWDLEKMAPVKEIYIKYFYLSIPAWEGIRCLLWGMGAYYVLSIILSQMMTGRIPRPIAFREWIVPEAVIFGLIAAGALKLFALENGPLDILGDNFLVFFVVLYTLAGFSIVSFFLNKWKLPRVLRVLGYVIIFWFTFLSVCCLGILDVWFDFRKLKNAPEGAAT